MAKSKYEYVREFESATDTQLLPDSYVVVRVDGQCFHRFSAEHKFLKPNDKRCLDLMNKSALHVMRTFYPNIILAYGQSDEYSFVIRRLAYFFNRRANKITSLITSAFTSAFVYYWPNFFHSNQNRNLNFRRYDEYFADRDGNNRLTPKANDWQSINLRYPPSFDGRAVMYPNERTLTDYLRWRQVDCHINNLYNTTFYALTGEYTRYVAKTSQSSPGEEKLIDSQNSIFDAFIGDPTAVIAAGRNVYSHRDATTKLSRTSSSDKNEIMFTDYGVNYNNELQQFRKGTILVMSPPQDANFEAVNLAQIVALTKPGEAAEAEAEAEAIPKIPSKSMLKKVNKFEEDFAQLDITVQERFFETHHCDIIGQSFWDKYGHLLKL